MPQNGNKLTQRDTEKKERLAPYRHQRVSAKRCE